MSIHQVQDKQNKRLAVISYHTCPLSDEGAEIGGMNVYVLELSKALSKKGYKIDIFTRSQSEESPKIVQVSTNLRVIHLPAGVEGYIPPKRLRSQIPEFISNFNKFVSDEKISYDFLSCHYYLSGIIGLKLKSKYNIPMLITFHTLAFMKNLVARNSEEQESMQRVQVELELSNKSDLVIATSPNDAEYLNTLYGCPKEKIAVLIPGINFDLFKPMDKSKAKEYIEADKDSKIILFVGRIQPLKGIDVLVYATKILLERNPDLKLCLWIVGGDVSEHTSKWSKELKKLENLRKLLHISASVKFVGRKEQDVLSYYYNASELVVMPSHYESFGMAALEAMSCGTPVITTDAAGVSGIFDKAHEALVTSANNPLLLAEKMEGLLADEKAHKKVSWEVYKNVQDLGWDQVADEFISFCKKCVVA